MYASFIFTMEIYGMLKTALNSFDKTLNNMGRLCLNFSVRYGKPVQPWLSSVPTAQEIWQQPWIILGKSFSNRVAF